MKYLLTSILLDSVFFLLCYIGTGNDRKNMKNFYSYADEIQFRIEDYDRLRKMIPKKQSNIKIFIYNLLFFSVIMTGIGIILQISKPKFALFYFFMLGESLNAFDFLVIDCWWWRKTKRTRFSEIRDEESYRSTKKHMEAFLRGIPLFIGVSILATFMTILLQR